MNENNKLYPLKFIPICKDKIWGGGKIFKLLQKQEASTEHCGECWEISGIADNVSQVKNGFLKSNDLNELLEVYMSDLVGEGIYDKFEENFPLLIKFIDASDDLSVQVHPDKKSSKKIPNAQSKTELWYIMHAEADAKLYIGFKQGVTKESFFEGVAENRVEEMLETYPVQTGDIFFILGGTVHAIGKGILLAEIQQASDTTYRIYDWNRKDEKGNSRELHLDLAEKVLNFDETSSPKIDYDKTKQGTTPLLRNPFFNLNYLLLTQPTEKVYIEIDSFVIYVCVEGEVSIVMDESDVFTLKKGETILKPAACDELTFLPTPSAKLLEIYME